MADGVPVALNYCVDCVLRQRINQREYFVSHVALCDVAHVVRSPYPVGCIISAVITDMPSDNNGMCTLLFQFLWLLNNDIPCRLKTYMKQEINFIWNLKFLLVFRLLSVLWLLFSLILIHRMVSSSILERWINYFFTVYIKDGILNSLTRNYYRLNLHLIFCYWVLLENFVKIQVRSRIRGSQGLRLRCSNDCSILS